MRRGEAESEAYSAEDDPTQDQGDRSRYARLFGRPVEIISLGAVGHTGALLDSDRFVSLLMPVLSERTIEVAL